MLQTHRKWRISEIKFGSGADQPKKKEYFWKLIPPCFWYIFFCADSILPPLQKTFVAFSSKLPGNSVLKMAGIFWWIFSGLCLAGSKARNVLKFGANSGNFEFGALSFCNFSDLKASSKALSFWGGHWACTLLILQTLAALFAKRPSQSNSSARDPNLAHAGRKSSRSRQP